MNRSIPALFQLLLDVASVIIALILSYWLRMSFQKFSFTLYRPLMIASLLSYSAGFLLSGSYREYLRVPLRGQFNNCIRAFLLGSFILLIIIYIFKLGYYTRTLLILYWCILIIISLITRTIMFSILRQIAAHFKPVKVKILSDVKEKENLIHLIHANPLIGYQLTEDDPDCYIVIGHLDDCKRYLNDERNIKFVPRNFMRLMKDAPLYDLPGTWLSKELSSKWLKLKKIWDFVFTYPIAIILTAISLPLFPVFAYFIERDSKGPVFFKQRRYTKGIEPFTLFKFRTMVKDAENIEINSNDDEDPRVTKFGAFLRRTSLDELPQLFNVLTHDMNLVGPRPLIKEEVYRFKFIQDKRLYFRAGLTGLVQTSGRKTYTLEEMIILDLYYVEHWSPLLDLELLFLTIPSILIGKGAY